MQRVWAQWDTHDWPGLPELHWNVVPLETGAPIATGVEFELVAAPGIHGGIPVIGVRAREARTGSTLAYSADGAPSPGVAWLARAVDLLVHEATGAHPVHSTAEQAAQLAREAGAKQLVFVHLSPLENDLAEQRASAERIFGRPVHLAQDLERYSF
jgi:ribonuclease Z